MSHVTITYKLSQKGQKASLANGGNGKDVQSLKVEKDNPHFALALGQAEVDKNGTAVVDLNFYGAPSFDLEPTTEELLGVRAKMAADRQREAEEKAARKLADTRAVFENRKLTKCDRILYAVREEDGSVRYEHYTGRKVWGRGDYSYSEFSWPYEADSDFRARPEVVAAEEELARAKQDTQATARMTALADLERKEREAAAEAKDKSDWIAIHGSNRLRRLVAEGIKHDRVYQDERIALELPGWQYSNRVSGEYVDPCNSEAKAFEVLDEARKLVPTATLVYWQIERSEDESDYYPDDEPREKYEWRGYAATARFLGREVVYGVPAEYAVN